MSNVTKSFDILVISLNVLHNYFDSLTKLFSDLLSKFLYRYFDKIVVFIKN